MALIKFKAPNLPIPPTGYSQDQQLQLSNALRLYFSQIDSTTPIQADYFLAQQGGGVLGYFQGRGDKLVNPYAMIMSNDDQASAGITSENLVSYDQPVFSNGITVQNSTRVYFPYPGQYLVTFRLQFTNRGNASQIIEVWAKDKTNNYPLSNTRVDIDARKSLSDWSHAPVSKSGIFTVSDTATDYLQLAWWSDGADVFLEHYAAGTNPTRPESPSVIMTVNMVSAIP